MTIEHYRRYEMLGIILDAIIGFGVITIVGIFLYELVMACKEGAFDKED